MIRVDQEPYGAGKAAFIKAARAEGLPILDDFQWPVNRNPLFVNKSFFSEGHSARLPFYDDLDYTRVDCPEAERAVPLQANSWCYQSLVDARGAASRYLEGCARDRDGEIASRLGQAAALYSEQEALLSVGRQHVPHPSMQANDDLVGVGYRLKGGDPWSADVRHAQAETLDRALALERQATVQLERARAAL